MLSSLLLLAASTLVGQADVPQAALDAMEYRVGKWKSTGYIDGETEGQPGHETTEWIPGRHAIRVTGMHFEQGVKKLAGGIIGWDAEKEQLVEHWYVSDGSYATFCYYLGKEKDAWIGTFRWVNADGSVVKGPSRVDRKSHNEWEWNATFKDNGEQRRWRAVSHRLQ